jgi:hypothetical protein
MEQSVVSEPGCFESNTQYPFVGPGQDQGKLVNVAVSRPDQARPIHALASTMPREPWEDPERNASTSEGDVNHSLLGEEPECSFAALAIPKARVLDAAEGHVSLSSEGRRVYMNHSNF